MIVGNKLDIVEADPSKRQVDHAELDSLCEQHTNMKFIETSAKGRINV